MTSADMQWPFYSGERIVVHGPLVFVSKRTLIDYIIIFSSLFSDTIPCILLHTSARGIYTCTTSSKNLLYNSLDYIALACRLFESNQCQWHIICFRTLIV